ncbi:ArnT family glycosyltransferase [Stenotrophomonas indicatrix]|uniref:ArnT family glycosyltransferase n=1 Tax=Stenotrophomonas indicatrix TaxID=2045451 RepID=UPI0028A7CBC7|nr:hypothetical protein [Stenotrophomonas indicatrix]
MRVLLALLLMASLALLSACTSQQDPAAVQSGGCAPFHSQYLPPDERVSARITYCDSGDGWTGVVETAPYPPGTRRVDLMLAGYPGTPGVTLRAVSLDTGVGAELKTPQPGERWQRVIVDVPPAVHSSVFAIRLEDASSQPFGWAGIGASRQSLGQALVSGALPMLAAVVLANTWLLLVAMLLPGAGTPQQRVLNALLAAGCVWLLVFNLFVLSQPVGKVGAAFTVLLPFLMPLLRRHDFRAAGADALALQRCLLPALLLSCLVLWIGLFPFRSDGGSWNEAASRWRDLPMDSWLPYVFGEMLAKGRLDVPMIGDWLSSDRPPLQVGLYLQMRGLLPGPHGLAYQGVSTWAQALVLVPLGVLAGRVVDRPAQAITLFVLALSPLMLLNTLFVWPKLIAATFCLIYYQCLFPLHGRGRPWIKAGIAASLALLAHGGALFFLVGVTALHLAWYRRNSLALIVRTAPVAALLYLPWIAYQRLVDPPGDRLIKWHFAGRIQADQDTVLQAISSAYAGLTPGEWISGRAHSLSNIVKGMFSGPADAFAVLIGRDIDSMSHVVNQSFFHLAYSMWFASPLLLVPCIALLRRQADPALRPIAQALAAAAASLLFWLLVMFEGGSTLIHQGAYAAVLLLQMGILLAMRRTLPWVFHAVSIGNVAVAIAVYMLDRQFLPGKQATYVVVTLLLTGGLFSALRCAALQGPPSAAEAPK